MTQATIGCDVDEVVCGLLPEWLRRYNRDYEDNVQVADLVEWDMTKAVKPECGVKIFDYLDEPGLYDCVEPIEGALAGVEALRAAGHRVVFVTSATKGHAGQKLAWLQRHGFLFAARHTDPDYLECSDKTLINLDLIIDDRATTVEAVRCRAILFPQPQNATWRPTAANGGRIVYFDPEFSAADAWAEIPLLVASMLAPVPGLKLTNPKDMLGSSKLSLRLFPATAIAMGSVGMLNGLCKYGASNFRVMGIRASIYIDALFRHAHAWDEGEECDPDDGVPHLAAVLACVAIIVDARAAGKMVDDRKVRGGYHGLVKELTPHVARLKELHAGKDPKHFTIADTDLGDDESLG